MAVDREFEYLFRVVAKNCDQEFERWTAKRKAALVTKIIKGKTSVAEASRDVRLAGIGERRMGGKRSQRTGARFAS